MRTHFSFQERKRFWTIGIMVFVILSLWLLFAPNGAIRYYRLRQEIAGAKSEIALLQEQNGILAEEIKRLKNDPDYLERLVREEYGWVRKNEIIFDFSNRKKKH